MDFLGGGEDFEKGIDINSILNDAGLNAELAALGWEEAVGAPATPPAHPPRPRIHVEGKAASGVAHYSSSTHQFTGSSTNQSADPVDIANIGMLEDEDIKLTDDDLQDESLLREFEDLQMGKAISVNIKPPEAQQSAAASNYQSAAQHAPVQVRTAALQSTTTAGALPPMSAPASQAAQGMTAVEAKRMAQQYNRQGNKDEAVKWLRHAKMLEKGYTPESIVSSASAAAGKVTRAQEREQNALREADSAAQSKISSLVPLVEGDAFSPLEHALTEAMNRSLKEAKAARSSDPRLAGAKMREYKAYQQELVVLQSRRNTPGAVPACFHWDVSRKEVIIENKEIPEDSVELTIEGAFGINSIMDEHHSKSVGLSFTVGLTKDEEPKELPPIEYTDGNVVFNHKILAPGLKRGSRYAETLYSRKKSVFDLILHKGNFLFRKKEVLGQATLSLNEFLKKSCIGGELEIRAVGEENGGTSKSRRGTRLGGVLRVHARIRSPLLGPEKQIVEERRLVLEPWPSVSTHGSEHAQAAESGEAGGGKQDSGDTAAGASAAAASASAARLLKQPAFDLSDKEKLDPHSPDFIESNDVLEAEIESANTLLESLRKIARPSDAEENEKFNTTLRLQLLQTKLQILVGQVQSGNLDMEGYLQKLRERAKRDQQMALYFKAEGDRLKTAKPSRGMENPAEESKTMIEHALRIMKRIKIMNQEISNAEAAGDEEQEE